MEKHYVLSDQHSGFCRNCSAAHKSSNSFESCPWFLDPWPVVKGAMAYSLRSQKHLTEQTTRWSACHFCLVLPSCPDQWLKAFLIGCRLCVCIGELRVWTCVTHTMNIRLTFPRCKMVRPSLLKSLPYVPLSVVVLSSCQVPAVGVLGCDTKWQTGTVWNVSGCSIHSPRTASESPRKMSNGDQIVFERIQCGHPWIQYQQTTCGKVQRTANCSRFTTV